MTRVEERAQTSFLVVWLLATAIKIVIAARLPLFVDEAFYWQEGQHLAAAYSDLPGLTAWLARLGVTLGGEHVLGLRLPFLLIGALIPWFVVRMAARWFGAGVGWQAGLFAIVMPLSGSLGILALPDVPMTLAAVMCLDAGARLLRQVNAGNAIELALGLAIGAFSHYRFLVVIAMGFLVLLLLPSGRRALMDSRIWVALSVGGAAWLPLLAWNADNHDAGLRFQLLDRHPWHFHWEGLRFLVIQPLLVTPVLFVAMAAAVWKGLHASARQVQWRYFALVGGISTLMIFVLGFFTDVERVSFHWPLPGLLGVLVIVPMVLHGWPVFWRWCCWGVTSLGFVAVVLYLAMVGSAAGRVKLAELHMYPRNFVAWETVAQAVSNELAQMHGDTRLVAGSFKVGAGLGFWQNDAEIPVLPHVLNDRHGRTAQLAYWQMLVDGPAPGPSLVVTNPADTKFRDLLARYQVMCQWLGPLYVMRTVSVDQGQRRLLLLRTAGEGDSGSPCVTPAILWVDSPLPGALVSNVMTVRGWAFKDGVGLAGIEVLIDGQSQGMLRYGQAFDVRPSWPSSTDPYHPNVGFESTLDVSRLSPGTHWLGLRLHGKDGSVEDWTQQPFDVQP